MIIIGAKICQFNMKTNMIRILDWMMAKGRKYRAGFRGTPPQKR